MDIGVSIVNIILMKNYLIGLLFPFVIWSCTEIPKVELSDKVKEERSISKPMSITNAEITAVANEIGDSLINDLKLDRDTSFSIGVHRVKVISQKSKLLEDTVLSAKFEAFQSSFDKGYKEVPALVSFKKRKEFAQYEVFKAVSDSTFNMVIIDVAVREATKQIAKERKLKK